MNDGEYVTEGSYVTPLPRTDIERRLWTLVIGVSKALSTAGMKKLGSSPPRASFLNSPSEDVPRNVDPPVRTHHNRKFDTQDVTPLLKSLTAYLESLTVNRAVQHVGASVIDVVVQLPDAVVRHETLRLTLAFPKWNFALCGPVTVAASRGDVPSMKLLLRERQLDPNCGLPLTVAVRHHQLEALQLLLNSRRIRPNHGGAFFEAVARRDMACIELLIRHAHLNLNRFAKNRGTTPLLHAVRGFMNEIPADGRAPTTTQSPPQHEKREEHPQEHQAEAFSDADERQSALVLTAPNAGQRWRPTSSTGQMTMTRVHYVPVSVPSAGHHSHAGSHVSRDSSEGNRCADDACEREGHQSPLSASPDLPFDSTTASHTSRSRGRVVPWTPASWQEVLIFLLQHPAVDVNSGFYATPLMIAILAEHVPLISLLLSFAHVKPNRVNPSAKGLTAAMHYLKHTRHSGVADSITLLVRTPLEAAIERRATRVFALLVRDRRVLVPQSVWQRLEQYPDAQWVLPFLDVLARYRPQWESWAWYWRRMCLIAAQIASSVLAVLHWWFMTAWSEEFGRLQVILTGVTMASMVPLGVWCLLSRTTPCASAPEPSTGETKPSSDALVSVAVEHSPRCGLPPSVFRWLLWLSLVCAPLVPLWPLYSALLTAQIGWVKRGPWHLANIENEGRDNHSHNRGSPVCQQALTASVPTPSTAAVVVDGGVRGSYNAEPSAACDATLVRCDSGLHRADDDTRSIASSTTTSISTCTTTTSIHHGYDSSVPAVSATDSSGLESAAARALQGASWGSAHIMHAVRRLSHHPHQRRNSQDSDASVSTQFTVAAETAEEEVDDGARVPAPGRSHFMLPEASVVPCMPLRAALYGLFDRLLLTNVLISTMGFVVHLNFLFPFLGEKDNPPPGVNAHSRTLLVVAGLACFLCSLIELAALMTSWFCLQSASPASLLSGSARTVTRRRVNTRNTLLL